MIQVRLLVEGGAEFSLFTFLLEHSALCLLYLEFKDGGNSTLRTDLESSMDTGLCVGGGD